jgi:CPA2 family monovalent cation:H+ antiporter-2
VGSGDFVRDFALIMIAAAAALIVFRLIRQPPILGYLLAGVLVGPFALQGRFVKDTETVSLVAEVGLVVLLFSIGVEFGWERIRRVGFRVVVIGAIEITAMMTLGYIVGRALGWSPTTSVYLGAAMAFSSSAVLVQIMRESGQMMTLRGQLVVGVLVVEDFVAVVLLAVFAGYANQDAGGTVDVWALVIKMFIFAIGALVFGTLLAPRFMDLLDYLKSRETLVIGSLGVCFGVGLLAHEMGLSAGAGAFLIGTVLGDTRHRDQVTRVISPVRDVFAALFFVSIGMLVNIAEIPDFFGVAMIVTGVLVAGKVLAATVGTFLTGHDGKTALKVGTAMPQPGEFSLAIARAGSEHSAVGSQLYPVVTISTLMASFAYPLVFRSHRIIGRVFDWLVPGQVKVKAGVFTTTIASARRGMGPRKLALHGFKRGVRSAAVSFGIIGLVVIAGVLISNAGTRLATDLGISAELVGVATLGVVVTLVVPSGIVLWNVFRELGMTYMSRVLARIAGTPRLALADAASTGLAGLLLLASGVWLVIRLLDLMSIGDVTSPVPALVMVLSAAVTATLASKVHWQMDRTFRQTLLGDVEPGAGDTTGVRE